jgi:hypothetical protein
MKAAPLLLLLSLPCLAAEKTLWLVRPLYPGQEALAGRTEQALDKLTPALNRPNHVIGKKELAAALKGKKADDLPCFQGETRCADPIDPFVATLGFDRVVLVQGGQDEAGFKFKVVSYEPASGKVTSANASDSSLDNALLGAVAKVVPITSTLEVVSTPPGATVYVDERKVGVTPVNAQVLPGERVVRLDLKLHQGVEETLVVPMRGLVKLERPLEKVAARIIITAQPAGTTISVDGQVLGKDKLDRGIQPGTHTIRLTAENHKAYEQTVQVKSDEQLFLDKNLEPLPGVVVPPSQKVVIERAPPEAQPPPPPPPTVTEQLYERKSYFYVGFAYDFIRGNRMVGRRFGSDGIGRTEFITSGSTRLLGGTGEFGFFGKYFGLAAIGASVFTNEGRWNMSFGHSADSTGPETDDNGNPLANGYDNPLETRVVIAHIRAIHPQFRIQLWRFMFNLQAGFELRLGHIWEPNLPVSYKDGFLVLDVLVSGRAGMRFYVADGFFLYGHYQFSYYLTGDVTFDGVRSAPTSGFTAGVGYAF